MRIGIDLGGTKTEGVVLNKRSDTVLRLRRTTPQADGYDAVLNNIAELVTELEAAVETRCTVGIGTPGSLSQDTALMRNSNTVCLNGQPVRADLNNLLVREIRMANDANCFTLSEAIDGAAAGADVVFGVILGTGTGGGDLDAVFDKSLGDFLDPDDDNLTIEGHPAPVRAVFVATK